MTIDDVREAVRQLSPSEQFQLIQELLRMLQQRYPAAEAADRQASQRARIAGLDRGSYWVSDDFDAELPDGFWLGGDDELVA